MMIRVSKFTAGSHVVPSFLEAASTSLKKACSTKTWLFPRFTLPITYIHLEAHVDYAGRSLKLLE